MVVSLSQVLILDCDVFCRDKQAFLQGLGFIHLVRIHSRFIHLFTQNFPKNYYFFLFFSRTYSVCPTNTLSDSGDPISPPNTLSDYGDPICPPNTLSDSGDPICPQILF